MAKANVKSNAATAEKWARRVAGATTDYIEGAKGAGGRWASGAAAGAQNFRTGVQEAAASGRFEKGIADAGPGKYDRGIVDKGAARFGAGAAAAQPEFERKIAPVLDAIRAIDLPPRGPRGADQNYNRAATIGKALRQQAVKR